jgi:hypothetical protein
VYKDGRTWGGGGGTYNSPFCFLMRSENVTSQRIRRSAKCALVAGFNGGGLGTFSQPLVIHIHKRHASCQR